MQSRYELVTTGAGPSDASSVAAMGCFSISHPGPMTLVRALSFHRRLLRYPPVGEAVSELRIHLAAATGAFSLIRNASRSSSDNSRATPGPQRMVRTPSASAATTSNNAAG